MSGKSTVVPGLSAPAKSDGSPTGWLLPSRTLIWKSEATLLPPLSLMTVLMTMSFGGLTTAPADSERSWLPTLLRFQSFVRMWYGEPLIALADRPAHSSPRAMWPPHASTAVDSVTENVIEIWVSAWDAVRSP
ncbi:MAG: hypothetical protein A2V85_11120 [Chloroflexi bacterium RBG_16_72_14]|nr:MAG: hypothetical protein A2V85_11120 [Chloroflexi bacterium RBG_16_72_14]